MNDPTEARFLRVFRSLDQAQRGVVEAAFRDAQTPEGLADLADRLTRATQTAAPVPSASPLSTPKEDRKARKRAWSAITDTMISRTTGDIPKERRAESHHWTPEQFTFLQAMVTVWK